MHARLRNSAETSLPWKLLRTYLESSVSIVQAVICHTLLPPVLLSRPNPLPDAVRSRNPSKSTLAHDVVAAAMSHKHHLIICVGAFLILFVYGSHPGVATELTYHRDLFSSKISRACSRGLTRKCCQEGTSSGCDFFFML